MLVTTKTGAIVCGTFNRGDRALRIEDLALALAAGGPALAGLGEKFPTGALATLEVDVQRWRDLDHGTATATTLVTPRSLGSVVEA